jgi:hypothetical protein
VVQLLGDLIISLALVLFHSVVLIVQFMTFSVAMNSKRSNALIALLIASNFVEIKGEIFVSPTAAAADWWLGALMSSVHQHRHSTAHLLETRAEPCVAGQTCAEKA